MNTNITTVDNGHGQSISVSGNSYRILVSGKETDGNYAVIDMLVPLGGGPGPHSHKDIQEMFYVAEGEVEFKTEDGIYVAKKGSFVNIPLGGKIHFFKNKSQNIAHLICTVVPAGLDAFFEEIGIPIETGSFLPPKIPNKEEINRLKLIGEKYGQQFYPADFFEK